MYIYSLRATENSVVNPATEGSANLTKGECKTREVKCQVTEKLFA